MRTGWVKLYRDLIDWQWFSSSKHLTVFVHLLLKATYTDSNWRGQALKPGQVLTGIDQLTAQTGLSRQNIRTVLRDLSLTGEITRTTHNKYSIITLTNWTQYQEGNTQANTSLTGNQHASNSIKRKKEGKKERIYNNKLSELFDCQDLRAFVSTIIPKTADRLHDKYSDEFLRFEIEKAFIWNSDQVKSKQKRNIATFLNNWFERSSNPDKYRSDSFETFMAGHYD